MFRELAFVRVDLWHIRKCFAVQIDWVKKNNYNLEGGFMGMLDKVEIW